MRVLPKEFEALNTAAYFVGCDCETAVSIYTDREKLLSEIDQHNYITFHDADGKKFAEVKIIDWQDSSEDDPIEGIWFETEF